MGIDYQKHLMNFFKDNQEQIMNPEQENSLAQIYKPIYSKATPKNNGYFDILFSFEGKLYIAKHIKLASRSSIMPLDFSEVFILSYDGTIEMFKNNGHVLKEEHIDNDFSYELSGQEQLDRISLACMTSFPFLDDMINKIQAQHLKVNRNDLCPCGSNKKYKKCCMN